jgi:hypothetical protein
MMTEQPIFIADPWPPLRSGAYGRCIHHVDGNRHNNHPDNLVIVIGRNIEFEQSYEDEVSGTGYARLPPRHPTPWSVTFDEAVEWPGLNPRLPTPDAYRWTPAAGDAEIAEWENILGRRPA